MTERTALNLTLAALIVVLMTAFFVLEAHHASNDAIVFAYLVVLSVGGFAAGRIVVHYADKPSARRKRD